MRHEHPGRQPTRFPVPPEKHVNVPPHLDTGDVVPERRASTRSLSRVKQESSPRANVDAACRPTRTLKSEAYRPTDVGVHANDLDITDEQQLGVTTGLVNCGIPRVPRRSPGRATHLGWKVVPIGVTVLRRFAVRRHQGDTLCQGCPSTFLGAFGRPFSDCGTGGSAPTNPPGLTPFSPGGGPSTASPISRIRRGIRGYSRCGRLLHTREVAGSKPAAPMTSEPLHTQGFRR